MKLNQWILPLHLLAIAVASGVGIQTDREATRLMAWALALLVAGWVSIGAACLYLFIGIIRSRLRTRDVVMCILLVFIGSVEKNEGAFWYDYLRSLPG